MSRAKIGDGSPNPVDVYIGNKVKARRLLLGLSQEELAKSIGLTFQQVQKYEHGTNRISVSRLIDISKSLKTPIDYFFDGNPIAAKQGKTPSAKGFSDAPQEYLASPDFMVMKRDVLDLVRAYSKIKSTKLKKQIIEMAKAMSNAGEEA